MGYRTALTIALIAASPTQAAPPSTYAHIQELIAQLGDSAFLRREQASQALSRIGEPALEPLQRAARTSHDFEIRTRAQHVVDTILVQISRSPTLRMPFVFVPASTFRMGSPETEKDRKVDERQHTVRVSHPFLIGKYEVTQDEYHQVMQHRPSWFSPTGEGSDKVTKQTTGRFPVDSITWFDALVFCNRLSERDDSEPYYALSNLKQEDSSYVSANVEILGGTGYRLPTEAEWECACRAGTSTPYHFGAASGGGNYMYKTSTRNYGMGTYRLGRTNRIGSYAPNPLRIFDMHGNVAEWCFDWYDKSYYDRSPSNDPTGPRGGDHRVLRGGSWIVQQTSCRSATRFWAVPGETKFTIGFRIVRSLVHVPPDATNPSR